MKKRKSIALKKLKGAGTRIAGDTPEKPDEGGGGGTARLRATLLSRQGQTWPTWKLDAAKMARRGDEKILRKIRAPNREFFRTFLQEFAEKN